LLRGRANRLLEEAQNEKKDLHTQVSASNEEIKTLKEQRTSSMAEVAALKSLEKTLTD